MATKDGNYYSVISTEIIRKYVDDSTPINGIFLGLLSSARGRAKVVEAVKAHDASKAAPPYLHALKAFGQEVDARQGDLDAIHQQAGEHIAKWASINYQLWARLELMAVAYSAALAAERVERHQQKVQEDRARAEHNYNLLNDLLLEVRKKEPDERRVEELRGKVLACMK